MIKKKESNLEDNLQGARNAVKEPNREVSTLRLENAELKPWTRRVTARDISSSREREKCPGFPLSPLPSFNQCLPSARPDHSWQGGLETTVGKTRLPMVKSSRGEGPGQKLTNGKQGEDSTG